uniref:Uncharacterized protein n=1 Tax=Lygus hesperus TaxID=30085 RepID=A0A0A9YPG0_LYGHE
MCCWSVQSEQCTPTRAGAAGVEGQRKHTPPGYSGHTPTHKSPKIENKWKKMPAAYTVTTAGEQAAHAHRHMCTRFYCSCTDHSCVLQLPCEQVSRRGALTLQCTHQHYHSHTAACSPTSQCNLTGENLVPLACHNVLTYTRGYLLRCQNPHPTLHDT